MINSGLDEKNPLLSWKYTGSRQYKVENGARRIIFYKNTSKSQTRTKVEDINSSGKLVGWDCCSYDGDDENHTCRVKEGQLVEEVRKFSKRVATSVSRSGELERLLSQPIDMLCFGRAGVGKTSLLEAMTGRNLGSSNRVDHGTTKLQSHDIIQEIPKDCGTGNHRVHIRLWDSKGIEDWKDNDFIQLFREMEAKEVRPLSVFYCASGNGRVDSDIVKQILSLFIQRDIAVFYVITNCYTMDDSTLNGQLEGGFDIMKFATNTQNESVLGGERLAWKFGEKAYLLAVNSKTYNSKYLNVSKRPMNITLLMQLCIQTLDEDQLIQFFLSTLHNRSFWERAVDSVRSIIDRVKDSFSLSTLFAIVWGVLPTVLASLFD